MSRIVDFYTEIGTDTEGRTLEDIWKFTFGWLEAEHNYIQWLFPTNEPSNFNVDAPILSEEDIDQFKKSLKIRQNLVASLNKMMFFFGLELVTNWDEATLTVVEGNNWNDRKHVIFGEFNHNHLRVTRILTCLNLVGTEQYAEAFFKFLKEHRTEAITNNCFGYWERAMNIGKEQ